MKMRWLCGIILFMSYTTTIAQKRQLFLIAGQSNAVGQGNSTESVKCATALTGVISRFRQQLGSDVPVYIVLTGYQTGRTKAGSDAVRAAQLSVATRTARTYIVYRETDEFAGRGWMKDFVHYNQTGLNDIGQKTARFISRPPD